AALGQIFLGAGALDLRAHRHQIVLDDVNARKLPQPAQIERFVECPLIDRPVAEEREADAAGFLVPAGESRAGAEGNLPAHDSMPAEVSDFGMKVVHRPALALGTAG